jgi:nucleoid-associated protein YgaU
LALVIVVILGFVGGIILRSASTGTTVHPRVTHSAVHSPVKPPKATPAPTHPAKAPAPHKARTAPHKSTARTYTVRNGDSLWGIAAHVYHNPLDWHKLYELNHSLIGGNPNLIHTGVTLQLE